MSTDFAIHPDALARLQMLEQMHRRAKQRHLKATKPSADPRLLTLSQTASPVAGQVASDERRLVG